ncbi:hypothetical protein, partial [Anaerobacillus sp. 1_MG-2023]|uniref:hypothetical protein n=1 Tax=Anaerobacillus sp. 1_MG-2023 TaxID=3062655 RepID=UPI0026E17FD8
STQTITWEVQYNYNEKTISRADAVLLDLFNDSLELVPNSITVEQVTINDSGKESGTNPVSNYTISPES